MCDFGNDPYPCSRYSLEVPRPGKVVVQLDFVGGDRPMFIAFETPAFHASRDNFVAIGGSPLTGSFDVSAKQLTVAVGVDAPYGRRRVSVSLCRNARVTTQINHGIAGGRLSTLGSHLDVLELGSNVDSCHAGSIGNEQLRCALCRLDCHNWFDWFGGFI